MQCFQECDQRSGLRRTQILPIGRHIAAALDHLPYELVLGEPHRNAVQSGPSLPAGVPKRMAVAALLDLEDESTLPLKRSSASQPSLRYGITAPSVHVRTPGRETREMGESSKCDGDHHHRQHSDWPAPPALFSFARKKWE